MKSVLNSSTAPPARRSRGPEPTWRLRHVVDLPDELLEHLQRTVDLVVRTTDVAVGARPGLERAGAADFVAAVENGPLSATQFHPEKSGDAGAQLLENWVRSL